MKLDLGHRRVIASSLGTLGAAAALLLALPLTSSGADRGVLGNTVNSLLGTVPKVTQTVQGTVESIVSPPKPAAPASAGSAGPAATSSTSSSGPAQQAAPSAGRAATGSVEQPAMYGTNPHGQGTVAAVSVSPSTAVPYAYSPDGSGGEVTVIGRGRSEQTSNGMHAHTTILDLLGHEILGVDATPGQSNTGPLDAVQTGLLDKVCSGAGQLACLTVLAADTSSTGSSANTHFSLAHATVGGANGIDVGVAEANSAIGTAGSCQSASGNGSVAGVMIAGGPAASAGKSSESSTACSGQAPSQSASSSVLGLGGTGLPVPASGCDTGVPNTKLSVLGLLTALCNAESTTQAMAPAGVREALTAIILPAAGTALIKTVAASSESHAVAPAVAGTPTPVGSPTPGPGPGSNPGGSTGNPGAGPPPSCAGKPDTGRCEDAGPAPNGGVTPENPAEHVIHTVFSGRLPFTGEDLLTVVLVGLVMLAGGLGLATRVRAA